MTTKLPMAALGALLLTSNVWAQSGLDVRGTVPFETLRDGARFPLYGSMLLRCDAGRCTLLKVSFLCDQEEAYISQAAVTPDRIRIAQAPKPTATTHMDLEIDDFGTPYSCRFNLRRGTQPASSATYHVESLTCSYQLGDGRRNVERSVEELDLKSVCKKIVLQKSPW